MLPFRDGRLEQSRAGVEAREAVARTRDEEEDLWGRVDEVEDLGDEEQEKGLGEVAKDADDCEDHSGEVAVRVPYEDAGRVPIVPPEGEGDANEGEDHV